MDQKEVRLDVDFELEDEDNNENAPFLGSSGIPIAGQTSCRADRLFVKAREVYHANVGLIMIAVSNIFGCGMNVCVKLLNGLEDPVPAVEVRSSFFVLSLLHANCNIFMIYLAGWHKNGMLQRLSSQRV